jgi:ferredoxin-like protein FixX
MIKLETKLFQNHYRVDTGYPHIGILDPNIGALTCSEHRHVRWGYPCAGYGMLFKLG